MNRVFALIAVGLLGQLLEATSAESPQNSPDRRSRYVLVQEEVYQPPFVGKCTISQNEEVFYGQRSRARQDSTEIYRLNLGTNHGKVIAALEGYVRWLKVSVSARFLVIGMDSGTYLATQEGPDAEW
jgi:hypothetical protein